MRVRTKLQSARPGHRGRGYVRCARCTCHNGPCGVPAARNRCERPRDGGASRAREHTWQLRVRSLKPALRTQRPLEGRGAALALVPARTEAARTNPTTTCYFLGVSVPHCGRRRSPRRSQRWFPGAAPLCSAARTRFACVGTAPRHAKAVLPSRDSCFHRRAHRRSPGGHHGRTALLGKAMRDGR